MKKILLLFCFFIVISCSKDKVVTQYSYKFNPSFFYQTEYIIDIKNESINQISYDREDTTKIYYQKSFYPSKVDLDEFLDKTNSIQLDSTIQHCRLMLDGMGYRISKRLVSKEEYSLSSNYSKRNEISKLEFLFLDPLFQLISKTNSEDFKSLFITDEIKSYLSYENEIKPLNLRLQKIGDVPLEYKIWGEVNSKTVNADELLLFLKKLPENSPVIFDLSNCRFSDWSKDTIIRDLISRNNFYFYGSKEIKLAEEIIKETINEINFSVKEVPNDRNQNYDDKYNRRSPTNDENLNYWLHKKNELNKERIFIDRNTVMNIIDNFKN